MNLNVYAIYDQKQREFLEPFLSKNDDTALRTYHRTSQQVPLIQNNPEDFDLYHIGSYHTTTGRLDSNDVVQKINNPLYSDENSEEANNNEQIQSVS